MPEEKQKAIIDAALSAFGRNGYKKASVGDIAEAAGISKAMVFYYFGSKKSMYFYLIELCAAVMMSEINKKFNKDITDFFDRLKMFTEIKISAMKKHPDITSFITSFFNENDPEVEPEKKKFVADWTKIGAQFTFESMDASKFKEDVIPELVYKFLIWAAEGFAAGLPSGTGADNYDAFIEEFYNCLDMMKKYFYV